MWGDSDEEEETPKVEEKKQEEVVQKKTEEKQNEEEASKKVEENDDDGWGNDDDGGGDAKENGPTEQEKAEAAAKIQAVQRGKAARQDLKNKQEAATKIQAVQRGKMARKEAQEKKQQEENNDNDDDGGWGDDDDDKVVEEKQPEPEKKVEVKAPVKPARKPSKPKRSPRKSPSASSGKPVKSGDKVYVVSHRDRTFEQARVGQARIKQRTLEAPSSELHKKSCLRRLKLPLGIPSIPIIVVIGDLASLDDDPQRRMLDYFTQGILRAAASIGALVVDSGLASGPCGSAPTPEYVDFVRKVCILGISPTDTEEPLSRYHTHQLVVSDFQGFEKQQGEFVKHKLGMVRRLAGKSRVVGVFVNNGHTAFSEVVEFSRMGYPTVVVEGSGDLADELCSSIDSGRSDNLHVKEMLGTNLLMKLNKDCKPADLAALLQLCLTVDLVGLNAMAK